MASEEQELKGLDRAAVLLLSLGEDQAAEVMKHLAPREVQRLGVAMSRLGRVSTDQAHSVMREFRDKLERQTSLGLGADQFLRSALTKALGGDRANSLIERILHGGESTGLENLKWLEPRAVAELIKLEHPQVVALVLSYIDPDQAAEVLHFLTDRLASEAMLRLANLDGLQPSALRELNDALDELLSGDSQSVQVSAMGGPKIAAEVLNRLDTTLSNTIMDHMRSQDEGLAGKVQEQMFVFDDLINVDDRSMQTMLREISSESLIVALKGANAPLREKFLGNMSKRAAEMLRDDMEAKGPVRLSEVEAAQKEILQVATRLESAGQIQLGGGGAEAMVG
ncbi:MAG: flagellar motor switch protein FliG [Betaproteobacteria bacterium]|jgi:flagellar motor switch protein FliG|nr:flagellar motor switch protein FliG [Betaproteobacteria bacterium]MBU6514067.1 flagellar motor switch protein FliG [Betaproteobacteria bacterium]MDE1957295.1 flagellar motor switch protein FliG [Betaproteobacteria bacterium]MDE2154093.1 flagellar motor switch protein FliG [Betaproteobacteria bacterium]